MCRAAKKINFPQGILLYLHQFKYLSSENASVKFEAAQLPAVYFLSEDTGHPYNVTGKCVPQI